MCIEELLEDADLEPDFVEVVLELDFEEEVFADLEEVDLAVLPDLDDLDELFGLEVVFEVVAPDFVEAVLVLDFEEEVFADLEEVDFAALPDVDDLVELFDLEVVFEAVALDFVEAVLELDFEEEVFPDLAELPDLDDEFAESSDFLSSLDEDLDALLFEAFFVLVDAAGAAAGSPESCAKVLVPQKERQQNTDAQKSTLSFLFK